MQFTNLLALFACQAGITLVIQVFIVVLCDVFHRLTVVHVRFVACQRGLPRQFADCVLS